MVKILHLADLVPLVEGKTILHCNSLGKDSVLSIEWLVRSTKPTRVISLYLQPKAHHPGDEPYLQYLRERYQKFPVEIVVVPNATELSAVCQGIFQNPIRQLTELNPLEFDSFDEHKCIDEYKQHYHADYIVEGSSKYEDFSRRTKFHQKGLFWNNVMSPLGMMTRREVIHLIKQTGIKLHPCYKVSKCTYDTPSYYKMRAGFIADPEFKRKVYAVYPLLALDEYRFEKLL